MESRDYIALEDRYNAHNYKPLDVVLERGEGVLAASGKGSERDERSQAERDLGKSHGVISGSGGVRGLLSPEPFRGEIRCDPHPRWSWDEKQICFDSVHEGSRQVYVVDVSEIVES